MPAHLSPVARKKAEAQAEPITMDQKTLDLIAYNGDLSELTAEQRTQYYNARCRQLGLDPKTLPLQFCTMKERKEDHGHWVTRTKLVLYSPKEATDQLRALYQITIDPEAVTVDDQHDIVKVIVRGRTPDGRQDTEIGAVPLVDNAGGPLGATQRANAYMRAFTKAKRRLTLSLVGGGILDESEVEDIPGAVDVPDYLPAKTRDGATAPAAGSLPAPAPGVHAADALPPAPEPTAVTPDTPAVTPMPQAGPPSPKASAPAPHRLSDAQAQALWARAQAWRPPFTTSEGLLQFANTLLNAAYASLRDLSPDHYAQLMDDLDAANQAPDTDASE